MRLVARAFVVFLAMGPVVACSELPPPEPPPPGLTVACRNSVNADLAILRWELIVHADPIESGEPFTATLDGIAVFAEFYLDSVQDALGGVDEINAVALNATVHVRSGTTGDDDVVLKPELPPYRCFLGRSTCNPDNDVVDDPPKPPGLRGNTDCEPLSAANPCGRFISLPISTDCEPGGICDDLGKVGPHSLQCVRDRNDFCITGDLLLPLQEQTVQYVAATGKAEVLFGWDDASTGATVREEGPNRETWILPEAFYEEPTGPNAYRVTVGGLPAAVECTMGVNCKDPELGSGCLDFRSSPTPDSELISFPIQTEAL